MKKNLLYLFLLIGVAANAKNLVVHNPDFETKLKKENNISTTTVVNPCTLNVIIGGTLDDPTSIYFVGEEVLGGTAPYTYLLDDSPSPNGKTFYASTLNPGIHTVVVQDANGCTGSGTFMVENRPLSIIATVKNPSCIESGSITCATIGGVQPYAYSISLNGGPFIAASSSFTGTFTYATSNPGTYQILVTDAIGTTSNTIAELISPTPISVTTTHTNVNCNGLNDGTITVTATGGPGAYTYSIDNGLTFQANPVFTSLVTGTYYVITKNSNGCTTETNPVTISEPTVLTAVVLTTNQIYCHGSNGVITIIASGGVAPYTFSINNGSSFQSSPNYNLSAGASNILVKDANGCTITLPITTTEPEPITATTIIRNYCHGSNGEIEINAFGGTAPYLYSVNGGAFQASPNYILPAGTYNIIVKDLNGCLTETSTTIIEPEPLTATATITKALGYCSTNAEILVTASGGKAPYTYLISNSLGYTIAEYSSTTILISTAGIYYVSVVDAYGCLTTTSPIILDAAGSTTVTTIIKDPSCYGVNDASITIKAEGGIAPYIYSINNAETFTDNPNFTGLTPGIYYVTTKDTNGCAAYETVHIGSPSPIYTTVSIENQSITVNATGGNANEYDYQLDGRPFQLSNIFTNVSYGNHAIQVRNIYGCEITILVTVNPSAPLLNGEKTLAIQFTPGQTLKDIIVDGQDIKWYSSKGTSTNKSKAPETTLPLDTELVDNTTYYASQTINGYESTERLAVTTKISLSTNDYALPNFKFYPNPVKNILTISNTSTIDEVVFISAKGDVVLTKQVNSTNAAIDLSALSKGLYFLKIKAEGTEKIIKLIKE